MKIVSKETQWTSVSKNIYKPSTTTFDELSPGTYEIQWRDPHGIVFTRKNIKTDELIEFPGMVQDQVIKSIDEFWRRKETFQSLGQLHRRGVFLVGPQGSGKTCTINIINRKLIASGGIVLYGSNPHTATEGLQMLRKIEPDRPLVYVMEDIDVVIEQFGEGPLLSLLDGENKVENIVFIATSNHPHVLSERLLDRPSRFDEIIEVGMPTPEARKMYLRSVLNVQTLSDADLESWVVDTDNFSIAHLRELIVSVIGLGRDYFETVTRLRGMSTLPQVNSRKKSKSKFGLVPEVAREVNQFYQSRGSVIIQGA